jgi:hypothetical protein
VSDPDAAAPAAPVLRVVGAATDEELAALAAVLAAVARTSAGGSGTPAPVSRWSSRADAVRAPAPVGPDAWRTSAWPHRS